jgi:tRNA 5-methylaminomethyl-2-thiouridine biosynthesis bifunctional protein
MNFSNIKWVNNNPYSIDFKDIYFSTEDGLHETEYVFIKQNKLEQRFETLKQDHFTIIETGFGTGLNFLAVCAHWLSLAPVRAKLHFISIEKYPLNSDDLARAQALWPQFKVISKEILQYYSALKDGSNHFSMAGGSIQLSLQADDVSNVLPQITQKTDAWILDGFAPAKNPDMWSSEVFEHIARLSKPDSTFATFTSAGVVRRGLQNVGFDVKKHTGFGKKREMLSGVFTGSVK